MFLQWCTFNNTTHNSDAAGKTGKYAFLRNIAEFRIRKKLMQELSMDIV